MAHFAKLSENNDVLSVNVVDNNVITENGVEIESKGQKYLETVHKWPAHLWKQCSVNTLKGTHLSGDNSKAFRATFPSIGFKWNPTHNIFTRPQPFPSWTLNTSTGSYEAPVAKPPAQEDPANKSPIRHYVWNEDTKNWDLECTDVFSHIDADTGQDVYILSE
jgi:hypothetical protein